MGVYSGQAGGWYGNISGGRPSSGGSGPGGPSGSVQYNDGGSFNGNVNGQVIGGEYVFQGVTLTSSGSGANALFDDGTYKPISGADNLIDVITLFGSDSTIFTFPSSISANLILEWDDSTDQPRLVNNVATETIDFSFTAKWDAPSIGYPPHHFLNDGTISAVGETYFTNTGLPIGALDLATPSNSLEFYLRIFSTVTGNEAVLDFKLLSLVRNAIPLIRTHGTTGSV